MSDKKPITVAEELAQSEDIDLYYAVKFYLKPKNPHKTINKGYMKDPNNVVYNVQHYLTKRLRDKHLTADVILNVRDKTVVKCRIGDLTYEELADIINNQS